MESPSLKSSGRGRHGRPPYEVSRLSEAVRQLLAKWLEQAESLRLYSMALYEQQAYEGSMYARGESDKQKRCADELLTLLTDAAKETT